MTAKKKPSDAERKLIMDRINAVLDDAEAKAYAANGPRAAQVPAGADHPTCRSCEYFVPGLGARQDELGEGYCCVDSGRVHGCFLDRPACSHHQDMVIRNMLRMRDITRGADPYPVRAPRGEA